MISISAIYLALVVQIIVFFIVGAAILVFVDVDEGRAAAQAPRASPLAPRASR